MKKLITGLGGAVIAGVGVVVFLASAYQVNEWDQVVITRFGKPVGEAVSDAGLHFRSPFVEEVNRFEKRLLEWDGFRNEIPTADKRFIWVDTTARWRIDDPLLFMQTVRTVEGAQSRLDDIIDSATRDHISANPIVEMVRMTNQVLEEDMGGESVDQPDGITVSAEDLGRVELGRRRIERLILASAQGDTAKLGIALVDVRIKRVNYRNDVRDSVYQRMISERNRIAERYRSEGQGRRAEILGEREREEKRISSEAERQALEIMARADATAARVYSEAYARDPEFYAFWRSLDAYREVVGANHTLVISPETELYRFLFEPGDGE